MWKSDDFSTFNQQNGNGQQLTEIKRDQGLLENQFTKSDSCSFMENLKRN